VLIPKGVKAFCFETLSKVFILKGLRVFLVKYKTPAETPTLAYYA